MTFDNFTIIGPLPHTAIVIGEVANERLQQIDKGYTLEHDDKHSIDTLARNAAMILNGSIGAGGSDWVNVFRPTRHSRRELLIIGAALAIAAIERLDREAARA